MQLVLLPGMDGSGDLFAPLLAALPPSIATRVVRYDGADPCVYEDLIETIGRDLPDDFVLLGESYSGPLALLLAARRPPGLRGVILCASFVRMPAPRWLCRIAALGMAVPFPVWHPALVLRALLAGWDAPDVLVRDTQAALAPLTGSAFRGRIRNALTVDATAALQAITVPLLYLQGTGDALIHPRAWAAIAAARPDARLATIEGPHFVLQRNPEAAAAEIRSFLADCV